MKKLLSVLGAFALCFCSLFYFSACNENEQTNIVTSNFVTYDFAKAVAGDNLSASMLVDAGAESHFFEPSISDINRVTNCDVFIYIGGENENWINTILENVDTTKTKVIRMFDYVDLVSEIGHEEYDEHIWTSPQNAIKMLTAIKDVLCEIDSDNAESYIRNFNTYIEQINEIDNELKTIKEEQKRPLAIADRNPYRYFLNEYNFDYKALIENCSGEAEPSGKDLSDFINFVNNNNVTTLFTVELSNTNIAKNIQSECNNIPIKTLYSCHNISKSDLDNGETYITLMQKNVENLREALT